MGSPAGQGGGFRGEAPKADDLFHFKCAGFVCGKCARPTAFIIQLTIHNTGMRET